MQTQERAFDAVPEPRSLVGSPLGGLAESFPADYFACVKNRFAIANAKYRATAKGKATRNARERLRWAQRKAAR